MDYKSGKITLNYLNFSFNLFLIDTRTTLSCYLSDKITDKMQTVPITNSPFRCPPAAPVPCDTFITAYTPDNPITCFHEEMGVLLGKTGIKQILVQVGIALIFFF